MTKARKDTKAAKEKIEVFEKKLSEIVGLKSLKAQLQSWANQILFDERRRSMGLDVGDIKLPHMAFLGNSGTGKTKVARMFGELLNALGLIPSDKVVEVQRTDLVASYINQTGPKTKEKIKQAKGGVLFVEEAYRLTPGTSTSDFGMEALEEIMSFIDGGETVAIFVGYPKPMQKVISAHEGFRKRVTKVFYFDDLTCSDLANMTLLKMSSPGRESPLYGFKLHPSCTVESIERVIRQESTQKQRKEINGGLVDTMLVKARENLDKRSDVKCEDIETLVTITMDDLTAGLRLLKQDSNEPKPLTTTHLSFYS